MNNKNIVLIQNTEIGGHLALSTFLTGLVQQYRSSDHIYSLICGYIDQQDQIWNTQQHMAIYEMWTAYNSIKDNLKFTRKAFLQLRKLHQAKHIDIIHCLYPNSSIQAAFLFKIFVSRKTKIIYDVRSPWIEMSFANNHVAKKKDRLRQVMHISERILTKIADYFVFISSGTYTYYTQQYSLSDQVPHSIIPTGTNVEKFSNSPSDDEKTKILQEFGISDDKIIVWYVGTVSSMREMDIYISTYADDIKNHPHIHFFIVWGGDGLDAMKDIVQKSWLEDQFSFTGKMKQSELIPYMHVFDYGWCHLPDIFVFRNSFPLKILEYMAVWLPILASDIKAHQDISQANPWVIDIYTKNIQLSSLVKKVSKWSYTWAMKYDWLTLYGQYLDIYKWL